MSDRPCHQNHLLHKRFLNLLPRSKKGYQRMDTYEVSLCSGDRPRSTGNSSSFIIFLSAQRAIVLLFLNSLSLQTGFYVFLVFSSLCVFSLFDDDCFQHLVVTLRFFFGFWYCCSKDLCRCLLSNTTSWKEFSLPQESTITFISFGMFDQQTSKQDPFRFLSFNELHGVNDLTVLTFY